MSKNMKIFLFCSLLLNILFIGVITGEVVRSLSEEALVQKQGMDFTANLHEDKKELFIIVMRKVYSDSRAPRKQIKDARERILEILSAREFDAAAYQVEVEKLHSLRRTMKQRLADATVELANQLNQEERKLLADFFKNPPGPPSGAVMIDKTPHPNL